MVESAHPFRGLAALLAVGLICTACSTTRQVRGVERSGFLGDYSQLKPGEGDQAQLVYIDPEADFKTYDSIIVDTVTVFRVEGSSKISDEDELALSSYLYQALVESLGKDYRIVNEPAPNALRLHAAITEAEGANVVGNSVTTIIPQLRLLSTAAGMASDTQVFVGKAGIEAEITDSVSGRRLLAAVDARAGGKTIRGGLRKWSDVKNAFDYWAQRVTKRLTELRGDAPEPT